MQGWMIFALFFALVIFCAYIIWRYYADRAKETGGIVNHDPFWRNFIFQVAMSREETLQRLAMRSAYDPAESDFDKESGTLTLFLFTTKTSYQVILTENKNGCMVRFEQVQPKLTSGRAGSVVNRLIMRKLDAVPVKYFEASDAAE